MNKTYLNELLGRVTVGSTSADQAVLKELADNYDIKETIGEYDAAIKNAYCPFSPVVL